MMPTGSAQTEEQGRGRTYAIPIEPTAMQALTNKQITEAKLPLSLYKDKRLEQRVYGLKATGEKYVVLKVDGNGMLSL
jgi:hypothetical protein